MDNGQITAKFDKTYGLSLYWLSRSGSTTNYINNPVGVDGIRDKTGRQSQSAFYASPRPFIIDAPINSQYTVFSRNSLEGGGSSGNGSKTSTWDSYAVQSVFINGAVRQVHYLKGTLNYWQYYTTPSPDTIEKWFWLEGKVLCVQNKYTTSRNDGYTGILDPSFQELPCLYLNGDFRTGEVYKGTAPYTGGSLSNVPFVVGGNKVAQTVYTSELGILKNADTAIGLMAPEYGEYRFEFFGDANASGPYTTDTNPSGYMTIAPFTIWGLQDTKTWSYRIILGDNTTEVRNLAATQPKATNLPRYIFNPDVYTRQGWITHFNSDQGVTNDGWRVSSQVNGGGASDQGTNIYSPVRAFKASDVQKIYIKTKVTNASKLRLYFSKAGQPDNTIRFTNGGSFVEIDVIGDGQFRTYELDMAANPNWNGLIMRFWMQFPGTVLQDSTTKFISYINENV